MKWNEPWRPMLRRQGRFNPFTRDQFKSGLIWSAVWITMAALANFTRGDPLTELVKRIPVLLALGFGISLLISLFHWATTQSISSGPRGILRAKGEDMSLIPWGAIVQHRFCQRDGVTVLELAVSYQSEPEVFFLPANADLKSIGDEIDRMTAQ